MAVILGYEQVAMFWLSVVEDLEEEKERKNLEQDGGMTFDNPPVLCVA